MKILIAADSFKDALSSIEVCRAIQQGLKLARPDVEAIIFPMSDGGEGMAEVFGYHLPCEKVGLRVSDPLGRPIQAFYNLSKESSTAVIEMAQASGLQLLKGPERNPLKTSTFGTGQLILDAATKAVKKILLGIGGSATNDGGMGMAAALGWQFLDGNGRVLEPVGENLGLVESIRNPGFEKDDLPEIEVICDVANLLFGQNGAAHVYARQKGADDTAVAQLDTGLRHFSIIVGKYLGKDFSNTPGAGAAGGAGFGALAFLNAKLKPGIEAVMEMTGFEKALLGVDLVITGEGKLDGQTLNGKLVHGICQMAAKQNVPVIAFCGSLEAAPDQIKAIGLRAAFSLVQKPQSLEEALKTTSTGLQMLAYNVLKIMDLGKT